MIVLNNDKDKVLFLVELKKIPLCSNSNSLFNTLGELLRIGKTKKTPLFYLNLVFFIYLNMHSFFSVFSPYFVFEA